MTTRAEIGLNHLTVSSLYRLKTCHFVAPHHPTLHPYMITCGTNEEISKVVNNSAKSSHCIVGPLRDFE